jgi:hypothetical protein
MTVLNSSLNVFGFLKIYDPNTLELHRETCNAIHYSNLSKALAFSVSNKGNYFISEMHFGNGGTTVDPTGTITFLPTNTTSPTADLYNPTYFKLVDDENLNNLDPIHNKIEVVNIPGELYTDINISCLLDFGEPSGQLAFDNSQTLNNDFVFDEIGFKTYSEAGPGLGILLSHVIFSPIQKSLNRQMQIDYTIRIQGFVAI